MFNTNDVLFVLISFRIEAPVERALIDSDPDHLKALKDNRYVKTAPSLERLTHTPGNIDRWREGFIIEG